MTEPEPDAPQLPAAVVEALRALAVRRPLLVALDFDGVLSPIVERAADARALPGTLELVADLARVPDVVVAMVSGRARADLAAVTGLTEGAVLLVGSHGAEVDGSPPAGLDAAATQRLEQVTKALQDLASRYVGAEVETKPSAAVLHTRRVSRDDVEQVTHEALDLVRDLGGAHVTRGKEVVEVAVTQTSKGAAIDALRRAHGVSAVLYVGDDVTDETVFGSLGPGDLGVKVGEGETAATQRIADPVAVQELLRTLLRLLG